MREVAQRAPQVRGCIPVVVQVDLDFAEASRAELGELVEMFRPVLVGRIEEGVLRWPPVGVGEFRGERRKVPNPPVYPSPFRVEPGITVRGFEMIGDAQEDVHGLRL
jgi:hypothetical protein